MRALVRTSLTVAVVAMLAACGSSVKLDDPPVESRSPVPVLPEGATSAAGSRGVATVDIGTASVSPIGRAGAPGAGNGAAGSAGSVGSSGAFGSSSGMGTGASGMGSAGMGSGGMGSAGMGMGGGAMGGGTSGLAGSGGSWGSAGSGAGSGSGMGGGAGSTGGAFGSGAGMGAGGAFGAGGTSAASAAAAQAQRDALTAEMLQGVGRVVYFDFDSFVVREDARPVIDGHARLLTTDRERRLVIEGHTDERGGREYNLALGQKRAEAVARSLVLLGAGEEQLEAVSFGEERPAVLGSDETAWSQNRRAELKDRP
ncbi:MAG: peptidoglycan-associated lipoprotein Pal [Rubrivivax sp.]